MFMYVQIILFISRIESTVNIYLQKDFDFCFIAVWKRRAIPWNFNKEASAKKQTLSCCVCHTS